MNITKSGALDPKRVTLVYTMCAPLGDFVVMSGLLKKYDLLQVEFESIVAHQNSSHVTLFDGRAANRFFNIFNFERLLELIGRLRDRTKAGNLVFGIPVAPGSLQAFVFFWFLKKIGAITHIVDFNLVNADIITPPRARYIYNRHLAQAAEIFQQPDWLKDPSLPLALPAPKPRTRRSGLRVGFFPWSTRSHLPEFSWQKEKWARLAAFILADPTFEIVLFGRDPGFTKFYHELRSRLPEELRSHVSALPAASVRELVNAMGTLDYLVTTNSAALHLGHALKMPLVAISGSSPEIWQPEGDHIHIVHDEKAALPPTDLRRHDPLQPSLQRIEVEEVYRAFLSMRRQFPSPS